MQRPTGERDPEGSAPPRPEGAEGAGIEQSNPESAGVRTTQVQRRAKMRARVAAQKLAYGHAQVRVTAVRTSFTWYIEKHIYILNPCTVG